MKKVILLIIFVWLIIITIFMIKQRTFNAISIKIDKNFVEIDKKIVNILRGVVKE